MLLINKTNRNFDVSVDGAAGGQLSFADVTTSSNPPSVSKLSSNNFELHGLSVAVVTLP